MKIAVIGSRSFSHYAFLCDQLSQFPASAIISGGARGADSLAARYARACGLPLQLFMPQYPLYGRSAPLVRNKSIVSAAQQVVAFWDGRSRGTAHALRCARQLGVPCWVFWPA